MSRQHVTADANKKSLITCPHCHSPMRIRTSEQISALVREQRMQCSNEDCSFSGLAHTSLIYELSPPAIRSAGVNLPDSPAHLRKKREGLL